MGVFRISEREDRSYACPYAPIDKRRNFAQQLSCHVYQQEGGANAMLFSSILIGSEDEVLSFAHVGGHFREHHLMMDKQADEIIAMTDPIAERVGKSAAGLLDRSVRLFAGGGSRIRIVMSVKCRPDAR